MIAFRQLIRQGQTGSDVLAVKRAMQTMHVAGSGGLIVTGKHSKYAGATFTSCISTVQRNHKIHQDGIYGEQTHAIIAPHFSVPDDFLYRTAALRVPVPAPVPPDAVSAAKRLLVLHAQGKYRDDRGTELQQIARTAQGNAVWSPLGHYVHLDERILEVLCWLIETKKFTIGTFALCSDHGPDGPSGHAGGLAVDISSINGVAITALGIKPKLLEVLHALHQAPVTLKPRQLISGGFANRRDADCSAQSIPAADSYYGAATMLQHCNHIHVGY